MNLRVGVLALTVFLAACTPGGPPPPEPPPGPAPTRAPSYLDGAEMPARSALRLIFGGAFVDVDAKETVPLPVTSFLPRPGHPPLLLDEHPTGADFGRGRVGAYREAVLPGGRTVVRLAAPAVSFAGASSDGRGLWLAEYDEPAGCTLREVGLDNRDRRPPRPVVCGTRPIAETPHGLWVRIAPDAFLQARTGTSTTEERAALLDPATLAEKATFPAVEPVDEDRVVVLGDAWELRDLRTGRVTPLTRPPAAGWPDPRVGAPSPDGRLVPFTFGEPSGSPQIMDVWVLDLSAATWTRLPLMPTYAALKATDVTWVGDGRLVMVGRFPDAGKVATWTPGTAGWQVRPFDRPATPAGAPVDVRFTVL